jgi:hypothetical protein
MVSRAGFQDGSVGLPIRGNICQGMTYQGCIHGKSVHRLEVRQDPAQNSTVFVQGEGGVILPIQFHVGTLDGADGVHGRIDLVGERPAVIFVADGDIGESASRPTVLVEKPVGEDLRALVWDDEDDEDYTTEIVFD